MPFEAMCPGCMNPLQVNDSARGKKVRCPSCKMVFLAGGAAAPDEDEAPAKGGQAALPPAKPRAADPPAKPKPVAPSTVKKAAPPPAAKPRTGTKAAAPPARKPAAQDNAFAFDEDDARASGKRPARRDEEDEDDRPTKKKKKSMAVPCLIGCGALFLLCGGVGTVAGYFGWQKYKEAEKAYNDFTTSVKDGKDKGSGKDLVKDGAIGPKDGFLPKDDISPRDGFAPKDDSRPKDGSQPKDGGQPKNSYALQPIARSITLEIPAARLTTVRVLFPHGRPDQAICTYVENQKHYIARYSLTDGRKLESMELPFSFTNGVSDVSPDGAFFATAHGNSGVTVYQMPNATPVLKEWLVPTLQRTKLGTETTLIRYFLLGGGRILTVNGASQAAVWSIQNQQKLAEYVPTRQTNMFPQGVAISPDRKRLALYNGDGFLVFDTDRLKPVVTIKGVDRGNLVATNFSQDGSQVAALVTLGKGPRAKTAATNLGRWDAQTGRMVNRFEDPVKSNKSMTTRLTFWGSNFLWEWNDQPNGGGYLIYWEKIQRTVRKSLGTVSMLCPGSPDGKCWFAVPSVDGKVVLKAVDLNEDVLKQGATGAELQLKPDGIEKK